MPLGGTDFSAVIAKIQAAKPDDHLLHAERRQQRLLLQADGGRGPAAHQAAGDVVQHRRAGSPGDGPVAGQGQLCRLELFPEPAERRQQEIRRRLPGEVRHRTPRSPIRWCMAISTSMSGRPRSRRPSPSMSTRCAPPLWAWTRAFAHGRGQVRRQPEPLSDCAMSASSTPRASSPSMAVEGPDRARSV